jgi:hypothetical protein
MIILPYRILYQGLNNFLTIKTEVIMPGFDRTGPNGQGPRTGCNMGKCNPENRNSGAHLGSDDFERGKGLKRGAGHGRGFGNKKGMGNR